MCTTGGTSTDLFECKVGVCQGDVLSPNLFKIFINDLPVYLKDTPDPVLVNNLPLNCLMYADDIVLLSTSSSELQDKLNKSYNFCQDWCLEVNVIKTKVLIFNKLGRLLGNKLYSTKNALKMLDNTVICVCIFQQVVFPILHKMTFLRNL